MMTTELTPLAARDDAGLVAASLAGDREAFGQIVARYQSLVCSLGYSATGNLNLSEDLAQEAFVIAWKQLAELREPAKLRSWLHGITRNLINSSLRRHDREPSHHAESLDDVDETRSPEPLPVERAISREEADILWRSLERLPENYREPLVLFYREHQSVEAVALNLELTEETVRQRLSRGRKLLQDEVLAFVEGALQKTTPGRAFTLAVIAALPAAVTSAKAATAGAAVVAGGAGAKGAYSLANLVYGLTMVGAIVLSWKNAVDETRSPRERRFMMRVAVFQVLFFVVVIGVAFDWLTRLGGHPVLLAVVSGTMFLAIIINSAWLMRHLTRRQIEIRTEDGTNLEPAVTGTDLDGRRLARRKAIRTLFPMVLMMAGGAIYLPWRQQAGRSAAIALFELLVLAWGYRRFSRMFSGQYVPRPPSSTIRKFIQHPAVLFAIIPVAAMLLGSGIVFVLNPAAASAKVLRHVWDSVFGPALIALVVYAVVAAIFFRKRMFADPRQAAVDKAYTPFFEQMNLAPGQCAQLKELILKRTMAGVHRGLALMNRMVPAEKRSAQAAEYRAEAQNHSAMIEAFLGEQNFQAFREYEKSIPDRTTISQLTAKLSRTTHPLTPDQQDRLLRAIANARARFPWTTRISRRIDNGEDYADVFCTENLEAFAIEEEQFGRQFATEAAAILHPAQLSDFTKCLEHQWRTQLNGLKIAVKLIGPAKG